MTHTCSTVSLSHRVRQPTRVLPVTQTSHGKETVDGGLSQSHLAIWGPQAGCPAPDKAQGGDCEMSPTRFQTETIQKVDIL